MCVTLNSGVTHCGTILADDGREITLNTPNLGRLVLPKINVVRIDDSTEGTVKASQVNFPTVTWMTNGHFKPLGTFCTFSLSSQKDEGYGSFH